MITQREPQLRTAPLYGDGEILLKISQSPFWKELFKKKGQAGIMLVGELLKFKWAMLCFATGALFRYRYGNRAVGVLLSVCSILMLVAVNSSYLYWITKPFFPFTAAFFIPFKGLQFWQELFFADIHSKPFLYYTCLFSVASLFHSISIWMGLGNNEDPTKRGDSIIYHLFFRYSRISEYIVQAVIEPALIGIAAALSWYVAGDGTMAIFLAVSGCGLFLQEVLDKASRYKLKIPRY